MTELLTGAQMRAIERAAIDSGEVTGLELMERAGCGVVEAIFEEWPELAATDHRAVVLCGPGNNGGDGFVVARLLKEWGWEVEVFLYGDAGKLPADARVNYERWGEMGEVGTAPEFETWPPEAPIVIDAIFGTGLTRAPLDEAAVFIRKMVDAAMRWKLPKLVSVDVPSGLCSDSGANLNHVANNFVYASLTVSFAFAKMGHFQNDGPESCGRLVVADIGLDRRNATNTIGRAYDPISKQKADYSKIVSLLEGRSLRPGFSAPESVLNKGWAGYGAHKYSHGHALILSGGVGKGGAARLAARGALRIGAGVVTVGCPPGALQENAGALDAVMVRAVKGGDGLAEVLEDKRINALCLGPGMGVGEYAYDLLAMSLGLAGQRAASGPGAESKAPARGGGSGAARPAPGRSIVFDADALTILANNSELFAALHVDCVLTPHAGEFARLFPDIAEKLNAPAVNGPAYSKVDASREAAARAGCVVLFKGVDTVIAAPDGRCSVNSAHYERSAPWLATAGSGDVLAGFICGLLARGFAPMQAAETAAWLHVECALKFGPGLIAEDLAEQLPAVFRDLGV